MDDHAAWYDDRMREWTVPETRWTACGVVDVIVIGAGPAGLSAALQLNRRALGVKVLDASRPGGLLWNANLVENYPGIPGGISGPCLAGLFAEQARSSGIEIVPEKVIRLDHDGAFFTASTASGEYRSAGAVIASGTVPRRLEGIDIPAGISDRVLYEILPIAGVSGRRIAVAGAGDAAFDYALNLAKMNEVTIIGRSERTKCLPVLYERAIACERIRYRSSSRISSIVESGDGTVDILLEGPDGEATLNADYLIAAIGRVPQTGFLTESLLDRSSELEKRNVLRFAGDVRNGFFRQAAIAAGDGIRAGMELSPPGGEE